MQFCVQMLPKFSEPPSKKHRISFVITVSNDVLEAIFRFSTRKKLALLELLGRRFNRIVDVRFSARPYIILPYLDVDSSSLYFYKKLSTTEYDESAAEIDIINAIYKPYIPNTEKKVLTNEEITDLPRYVQFQTVDIHFYRGDEPVELEQKFEIILPALAQIRPAFSRCQKIRFDGYVGSLPSHFDDSSALLLFLSERLLPIAFEHCPEYKFSISFLSSSNVKKDVEIVRQFLINLLELAFVANCSKVTVFTEIYYDKNRQRYDDDSLILPVGAISSWLDRPAAKAAATGNASTGPLAAAEGIDTSDKSRQQKLHADAIEAERSLDIDTGDIRNIKQMVDALKKV